jgi:hypothetical protein
MLTDFVNVDDVRMRQSSDSLGLGKESATIGIRRESGFAHHFDCDDAAKRSLFGAIDDPHAPTADLVEDFVIAKGIRRRTLFDGWLVVGYRRRLNGESGRELRRRPERTKLVREVGMLVRDSVDIRLAAATLLFLQVGKDRRESVVAWLYCE